jgi:hypothetical protein
MLQFPQAIADLFILKKGYYKVGGSNREGKPSLNVKKEK